MHISYSIASKIARCFLSVILAFAFINVAVFVPSNAALADDETASSASNAQETVYATTSGEGGSPDVEYVEGEIIIAYADQQSALSTQEVSTLTSRLDAQGITVTDVLMEQSADNDTMVLAEIGEDMSVEEAITAAESVAGVEYAQPNYIYRLVDESTDDVAVSTTDGATDVADAQDSIDTQDSTDTLAIVNDPYVESGSDYKKYQYYLYGDELDTLGVKGSNVLDAWDYAQTNHTQTIAIFDTGANLTHEDLKDNILADYAYDMYHGRKLEASGSFNGDYYGHGTHVAGICAGVANNGVGIAGSSYNADLLVVKVFDDSSYNPGASTSTIVSAYNYMFGLIDDGTLTNLHVVNMSLGMYSSDSSLKSVVDKAHDSYEILNVCAGGNGDDYGNPYTTAMYPSDYDSCFAVTALDYDGTNMTWSDYNQYKDISAPGSYLYSTYNGGTSSYTTMSGTSMASPLVAGIAALLWSIVPDASVDEIIEAIEETATAVPNDSYDRANKSGSHGAVDAAAAVEYITKNRVHTRITYPSGFSTLVRTQTVELGVAVSGFEDDVQPEIAWTWSIDSGDDIARVDAETGVVTGLNAGTATVRVDGELLEPIEGYDDINLTATAMIRVEDIVLSGGLTATTGPGDSIDLAWTACDGAVAYSVMRAKTGDDEFEEVATVSGGYPAGTNMTYSDFSAETLVLYNYYVVPLGQLDGNYVEGVASSQAQGCRLERVATLTSQAEVAQVDAVYNSINNTYTDTVIIAGENDAPRSVSVAGLAGVYKAPVFVSSYDLSDDVVEALVTLNSAHALSRIIVVGDTSEISDDAIAIMGGLCSKATITRYATSTATKAAEAFYGMASSSFGKTVLIISGDEADAEDTWAVSSYAYAAKAPIFVTNDSGSLSVTTRSDLTNGGFTRAIVVGDSEAISDSVIDQVEHCGVTCDRIAGDNPYQTAMMLVRDGMNTGVYAGSSYYVSRADTDTCLVAGTYAGRFDEPLIMVDEHAEDVLAYFPQSSSHAAITFIDAPASLTEEESDRVQRYIEGDTSIEPIYYGSYILYGITLQVEEGGQAYIGLDEEYATETVTVTVAPDAGYKVSNISVVGDTTGKTFDCTENADGTWEFTMPFEAVTVTVSWELNLHTVTFNTRGGNEIAPIEVIDGQCADAPAAPVRTGWAFTDWFADEACSVAFDFSEPITGDTTLYAGWKVPDIYTVTFDSQGGSEVLSQEVAEQQCAEVPEDPVWDGYEFLGWFIDADCTQLFDFSEPIVSDLTLYAGWLALPGTPLDKSMFVVDTSSATYTGEPIETHIASILTPDVDYTVEYKNNVSAGTAQVIITGVEPRYEGTLIYEFEIERTFTRLAGDSRYATMEAVDSAGFESAETVVLTAGTNFPDALAASGLAGTLDSPVLLTTTDELSSEAAAEIERLGAHTVYVVGGAASVSDNVVMTLRQDLGVKTTRIAGDDRYATALAVYQAEAGKWGTSGNGNGKTAIIAAGGSFADALSISPYAWWATSPIFLASSTGIDDATASAIANGGFERILIIGGENSVSADVEAWAAGVAPTTRLSGADRYATSVAIATWAVDEGMSFNNAGITTGKNFPDALAGGALCGSCGSVMLLADIDGGTQAVDLLAAHTGEISRLYYLGGDSSVTPALADLIQSKF